MSFDSHLRCVRDEDWPHAIEVFVHYCGRIGEEAHPRWFSRLYKIYSFGSATYIATTRRRCQNLSRCAPAQS